MATTLHLIKSVTPAHYSTEVPVTSVITIVFQEAMTASSLNQGTIFLQEVNGPAVDLLFEYTFFTQTLRLTPRQALAAGTQYQLKIASGENGPVTILSQTLPSDYYLHFTTAADTTAVVASSEETPAEEPPAAESSAQTVLVPTTGTGVQLFLVDSYPQNEMLVKADSRLVFSFNEALDPNTDTGKIVLRQNTGNRLLTLWGNEEPVTLSLNLPALEKGVLLLSPAEPLAKGKKYLLEIEAGLTSATGSVPEEPVRIDFYTEWDFFYTTVEEVKLLLGLFAAAYSDIQIAEMIHQQSVSIYQILSMAEDFDPLLWQPAPYAATQYVLYRTAYAAMLSQSIENSSGLKKGFSLGDLSVSESSTVSSEISDLLKLLQDEMDKWYALLNGQEETTEGTYSFNRSTLLGSAAKAATTSPYPDYLTRVPFSELGG